jgi:hypothetical protein
MLKVVTDELNLLEVKDLIENIKDLKNIDYDVFIESIKGTEAFCLTFSKA